jgi:chemotaxis protein methyltransferase CheR
MKLSLDDFKALRDLLKEKTGIFLKDEKLYFLESRLNIRCRELNCPNAQEYYRLLKYDATGREMHVFVESITTNETYFFRDVKQLNTFAYEALPLVLAKKRAAGNPHLRIWCAGCSTGEEPYTLAILCNEVARDMLTHIIATDINTKVIDHAKRGVYVGRSLKEVPPAYLARYFTPQEAGYAVNQEIRSKIEFLPLNLVDRLRMRLINDIDFIFCRNVLIYFDHPTAKQVINYFYDSLNKSGFIFLGLAESMHLFSGAYKVMKFKELFGYMKE